MVISPAMPDESAIPTPSGRLSPMQEVITISENGMYRSITGADLSRPIFDGRITNPAEHLIDLDTDGMETALDVRCYFWFLGDFLHKDVEPLDHTLEEAIAYDNQVVREGRLRLKAARDNGQGHFLNEDRDFASYNEFGKTWYRMPTFGLVADIVYGAIKAQQGEGYIYDAFEDSDVSGMNDMEASSLMMTNIRIPILWADFASDTFRQGSADWHALVMGMYTNNNPLSRVLYEHPEIYVLAGFFALSGSHYADRVTLDEWKAQQWPSDIPYAPNAPSIEGLRNLPPGWAGSIHKPPLKFRVASFAKNIGFKK